MEAWKEIARHKQQIFLEIFGSTDWDVYRTEERRLLEDKVAMVIFGPPDTEYDRQQVAHIQMVTDTIVREDDHYDLSSSTWMSIIMVVVKPPKTEYYCHPVFRVPKQVSARPHAFVDCTGRVYRSWKDFLDGNKLPESEICYPLDGVYSQTVFGEVKLGFACTKFKALLKVADGANNLLAVGSIGVTTAALALPVSASMVAGAAVVSAACGVYDSARAIHDQVDRARHGQKICFRNLQSVRNWAAIGLGLVSLGSTFKIFRSMNFLTKDAKLGVAGRSFGALRTFGDKVPREMYRDVRGKAMPLRHLSRYALLFGHVIAGARYIAGFLVCPDGTNCVLDLRSRLIACGGQGESLRYLQFLGFEGGMLPDILKHGLSDHSCQIMLSFACDVQTFEGISTYVRKTLERGAQIFANFSINWEDAINYFQKPIIIGFLELSGNILKILKWDTAGAVLGVLSMLYFFLRHVVSVVQTGIPRLKFTQSDILQVAKIYMEKNDNFYDKFSRLCSAFLLPKLEELAVMGSVNFLRKSITYTTTVTDLQSYPSEGAVLEAVSSLVGIPLDSSKAKVAYAGSEIFVIIMAEDIPVNVVQVVQDKKGGVLIASLVR